MKPYIICHMMQSIDGRIACDMVDKISSDEYYTTLDALECNAFIEGKQFLTKSFGQDIIYDKNHI